MFFTGVLQDNVGMSYILHKCAPKIIYITFKISYLGFIFQI